MKLVLKKYDPDLYIIFQPFNFSIKSTPTSNHDKGNFESDLEQKHMNEIVNNIQFCGINQYMFNPCSISERLLTCYSCAISTVQTMVPILLH